MTIELKLDEKLPNIIDTEFTEKDIEINDRKKERIFQDGMYFYDDEVQESNHHSSRLLKR